MLPNFASSTTTSLRSTAQETSATASHRRPAVESPRVYIGTQPFERFGRWAAPISVARDGTIGRLARWLALHQQVDLHADELWNRCRAANPRCFRKYHVVTMDQPSFFLPAGDVIFEVVENPTQIPDRPPQGVMLRHMEALDAFASATFYFLRPVFVTEPSFRLLTAEELRCESYFDQFDAMRAARHFGWAYRAQAWLAAKRDAAALFALRAVVRSVEALTWELMPTRPGSVGIDSVTRRRLRRQREERLVRTESLGLAHESRRLEIALAELRRRITIDPVLAFEVATRPGELWFEAHWFEGCDGLTYVHY